MYFVGNVMLFLNECVYHFPLQEMFTLSNARGLEFE